MASVCSPVKVWASSGSLARVEVEQMSTRESADRSQFVGSHSWPVALLLVKQEGGVQPGGPGRCANELGL